MALAGAGVAVLRVSASAEGALTTTRLSDRLAVTTGAGGNVVVCASPDGLLLVNGGARAQSMALLAEIGKQFGPKPVRTLINTDWHPEHTGSNEAVLKSGGTVIAHEHTKQYIARSRARQSLPTKTFYTSEKLDVAGETIEYGQLGQAHTDGDIYVYFRGQNVLAAGDLLTSGAYPIADVSSGGWLGGMATATKTLLDMTNAQTRFVPGVGPILSRADVEAQQQMLQTLRDRIAKMMRQGMGADDMLASGVTKDFDAKWGDPKEFVTTAYKGMWLHVRELGGIV